ncbi:glucose-1-phosphate thymidylyltransferase, partial [Cronobacter sakazakii]|nr:Glucose-1-phosphate thymidylyltransferase [Cronobacter sakazakii 701]
MMVACPEEIAWRNGWLTVDELRERGQMLKKNHYGKYLLKLIN